MVRQVPRISGDTTEGMGQPAVVQKTEGVRDKCVLQSFSGLVPWRLGAKAFKRFKDHHVFVAGRSAEKLAPVVEQVRAGVAQSLWSRTQQMRGRCRRSAAAGPSLTSPFITPVTTHLVLLRRWRPPTEASWRVCCLEVSSLSRGRPFHEGGRRYGLIYRCALRWGRANFGAFNSSKAPSTFAQALAKECGPAGIHVGHVVVDGPINGDKIRFGFPEYAEKLGDERMISLEGIVDATNSFTGSPGAHGLLRWMFARTLRTGSGRWPPSSAWASARSRLAWEGRAPVGFEAGREGKNLMLAKATRRGASFSGMDFSPR